MEKVFQSRGPYPYLYLYLSLCVWRRRRYDSSHAPPPPTASRPRAPPQEVHAKYRPGPLLGRGAYGTVLGCTNKTTRVRYACKSVNITALLKTHDGANVERRLRNEIGVMSYLAGESAKKNEARPVSLARP